MTIQEAIQLALENGWHPDSPTNTRRADTGSALVQYNIGLDIHFWQALGKGMGWDTEGYYFQQIQEGRYMMRGSNEHTYHWHRLIDHLADGKSIEDFFANLK